MEWIKDLDYDWHPVLKEMPVVSLYVELLSKSDNRIIKAKLVGEMSGWYVYLNSGWGSFDDYSHWRFDKDIDYSWYFKIAKE